MTYKCNSIGTKEASKNVKSGSGRSERDELLNLFARKADISLNQAQQILTGQYEGVPENKLADFGAHVAEAYGAVDVFQIVYESMEARL